jgi:huntingtin interacting protein 1
MLIALYCKLLVVKLDFHHKTPEFPGSLNVDKETLLRIGNNDAGQFYELCIEFLDYMDEILALERGVFSSLDMSKATSMTAGGQCRLAPLIVCIQDSVHLYDYTVKLLFLLHQHLPPDTLSGHSSRFLAQFDRLRKFYYNSSNLQYFKHLVQVPTLPATPPNFAVISELSRVGRAGAAA